MTHSIFFTDFNSAVVQSSFTNGNTRFAVLASIMAGVDLLYEREYHPMNGYDDSGFGNRKFVPYTPHPYTSTCSVHGYQTCEFHKLMGVLDAYRMSLAAANSQNGNRGMKFGEWFASLIDRLSNDDPVYLNRDNMFTAETHETAETLRQVNVRAAVPFEYECNEAGDQQNGYLYGLAKAFGKGGHEKTMEVLAATAKHINEKATTGGIWYIPDDKSDSTADVLPDNRSAVQKTVLPELTMLVTILAYVDGIEGARGTVLDACGQDGFDLKVVRLVYDSVMATVPILWKKIMMGILVKTIKAHLPKLSKGYIEEWVKRVKKKYEHQLCARFFYDWFLLISRRELDDTLCASPAAIAHHPWIRHLYRANGRPLNTAEFDVLDDNAMRMGRQGTSDYHSDQCSPLRLPLAVGFIAFYPEMVQEAITDNAKKFFPVASEWPKNKSLLAGGKSTKLNCVEADLKLPSIELCGFMLPELMPNAAFARIVDPDAASGGDSDSDDGAVDVGSVMNVADSFLAAFVFKESGDALLNSFDYFLFGFPLFGSHLTNLLCLLLCLRRGW